jgi:hypothetical protein
MKYYLIILLSFAIGDSLFSQENGKMIFNITPTHYHIRISEKTYEVNNSNGIFEIELPAGEYDIKIWAPTRTLHEDKIIITSGASNNYKKNLSNLSEYYKNYKTELTHYHNQKIINPIIIGLDLGISATTVYLIAKEKKDAEKIKNRINSNAEAYTKAISPEELAIAKQAYLNSITDYDDGKKKYKKTAIIGYSVIAIANAATIYRIIKRKKNPLLKPTYEEKNPLVNINFNIDALSFQKDAFQLNMVYNF